MLDVICAVSSFKATDVQALFVGAIAVGAIASLEQSRNRIDVLLHDSMGDSQCKVLTLVSSSSIDKNDSRQAGT